MGILISVITITLLVLCYVRMYNRLKRLFVKVQEDVYKRQKIGCFVKLFSLCKAGEV